MGWAVGACLLPIARSDASRARLAPHLPTCVPVTHLISPPSVAISTHTSPGPCAATGACTWLGLGDQHAGVWRAGAGQSARQGAMSAWAGDGRAEEPASSQTQASHRHGPVPIYRLARLVRLSSALVVGAAGLPWSGAPGAPERRPRAASTRPRRGTQERVRGTTPHSGLAVIGTAAGPATALADPSVICCAKTTALHAATPPASGARC